MFVLLIILCLRGDAVFLLIPSFVILVVCVESC